MPIDNVTLAYASLRVTASHFVLYLQSVVEAAGFCANEAWLEQYFRAPVTFGAKSDDVFRLGAHRSSTCQLPQ